MDYFTMKVFVVLSAWMITLATSLSPPLILTPLIHNNRTQEARNLSRVDPNLFLGIASHSGFLTVDQRYDSNTFFWYFPVEGRPLNETPWIIWLQGGPGSSSLAGLFDELGPFQYDGNLKLREFAWTKNHSMLFIDNPIGAGYSFTNSSAGYATTAAMYTNHLYSAVQQFLTLFPELRTAPLYIAGESYAGRYVPPLGEKILHSGKLKGNSAINLQGLIMGNPVFDREDIANYSNVYLQWGLIDTQGALAVKSLQDEYIKSVREKNVKESLDLYEKLLEKLDQITQQQQAYNFLKDSYELESFTQYLRREEVREALHVGDIEFTFTNRIAQSNLKSDFLISMQSKMETLLEHYRILIYCGQLDLTTPCVPSAQARRRKWRWNRRADFLKAPRRPWYYHSSITGYVKSGGGLTEVLVKGAGHLVPIEKPAQAEMMISHFIRNLDLAIHYAQGNDTPDYVDLTVDSLGSNYTSPGAGLITSIVFNVLFIVLIAGGVWFFVRWKRRYDAYLYSPHDTLSDDLSLS